MTVRGVDGGALGDVSQAMHRQWVAGGCIDGRQKHTIESERKVLVEGAVMGGDDLEERRWRSRFF